MSGKIVNAANIPIGQQNSSVPDLSGALQGYFQKMVFVPIIKTVSGFQVVEDALPIECMGVIMPLSPRQLLMKPEGQRGWAWSQMFCEPWVGLKIDNCIEYLGVQFRIMAKTNYELYGYQEFHLVQDWEGAGP